MKKIARRNFLKLVGVSASIPILQSLPIASASATDLSDYPLLKDGIFDFENTDITQYVDDVQEVFGSEKDMIEEMLSSGELTPQDLKQHLLELAEQPSSVLVERGFSESQIAIIEEYDGIEDAFDYLYAPNERTGIARSSATVKFLYGLAGSGSRQKVTIAYDIKWSERPIYVGIDSFGIGWIAADSSSHQLATKTASAVEQSSHKTVFAKVPAMGQIWRDFGHAFSFASSSSRGIYPSPSYLIWMCCTRFPLDLSGAST